MGPKLNFVNPVFVISCSGIGNQGTYVLALESISLGVPLLFCKTSNLDYTCVPALALKIQDASIKPDSHNWVLNK